MCSLLQVDKTVRVETLAKAASELLSTVHSGPPSDIYFFIINYAAQYCSQ